MDPYRRIVFQAFGVPDVLTEENQAKAAARALLRAAELSKDENSWDGYQRVAEAYVEALAERMQSHQFDSVIGGYERWISRDYAKRELRNAVPAGGAPYDDVDRMSALAIDTLLDWLGQHADAVRDLAD